MDLSYRDIEEACINVYKQIDTKPDAIIAISTGGLIPAVYFSKLLDVKKVAVFSAYSYNGKKQGELNILSSPKVDIKGKNVLLVDELVDSGNTMSEINKILEKEYFPKNIHSAVLYYKPKSKFVPDYYYKKEDSWINLPWEEINL